MTPTEWAELESAELRVLGRIMPASNATFLCQLGDGERRAVYKPIAGERPLWDFPHGTLAEREYAAWLVSDALGWDVVPPTVLREGPHGVGMAQRWCEVDPDQTPVEVVPRGAVPAGHVHVLHAEGADGEDVELTHEASPALLRMAVFDIVTNNTDRKGGHILAMSGGHRHGVDHGICFHEDDKLRTVLWGFAGQPLPPEVRRDLHRLIDDPAVWDRLEELLSVSEVARTRTRAAELLSAGVMPEMGPGWPAIPWPPF